MIPTSYNQQKLLILSGHILLQLSAYDYWLYKYSTLAIVHNAIVAEL